MARRGRRPGEKTNFHHANRDNRDGTLVRRLLFSLVAERLAASLTCTREMAEPRIVRSVFMDKTLEQHTLQATSPGGRVREHRYETLRTPDGETAGDRANRKKNNRNRALRARKALEKKLTQDTPPAAAPAAAPELPAATERKKRTRVLLPGVRPGSKLAKLSIYEQASAMMEAEALDCDADELLDGDGGGGGSWGMGGWWQDPWEENEIERLRREAQGTGARNCSCSGRSLGCLPYVRARRIPSFYD